MVGKGDSREMRLFREAVGEMEGEDDLEAGELGPLEVVANGGKESGGSPFE